MLKKLKKMDLMPKDCAICISNKEPEFCQNLDYNKNRILRIIKKLNTDEEFKDPI